MGLEKARQGGNLVIDRVNSKSDLILCSDDSAKIVLRLYRQAICLDNTRTLFVNMSLRMGKYG